MRKVVKEPVTQKIDFENKFKEIGIDDILINENNMRKFEANERFDDLVKSISFVGLINPITVLREGRFYKIIAGMRRLMAVKKLGLKEINCNIVDANTKQYMRIQFEENILREEVNAIDEGLFLSYYKERLNSTNKELGDMLQKSESYISKRIFLTEQYSFLQEAVKDKRISINAAIIISKCKDLVKMKYLIDYFDEKKLRDVDLKTFVDQVIGDDIIVKSDYNTDDPSGNVYPEMYSEPKGICDVCGEIKSLSEIKSIRICKACAQDEEVVLENVNKEG